MSVLLLDELPIRCCWDIVKAHIQNESKPLPQANHHCNQDKTNSVCHYSKNCDEIIKIIIKSCMIRSMNIPTLYLVELPFFYIVVNKNDIL